MSRLRHRSKHNIYPWLSVDRAGFEKNGYTQVGHSLLLSEAFTSLSMSARYLYITMASEAATSREFKFPLSKALRYGFTKSTFQRAVRELKDHGFISYSSGWNTRTPNEYQFEFGWKNDSS